MLLLPYGTDAPVYYFPWGTITLAVVNLLCYVFHGNQLGFFDDNTWAMHFGGMVNPLEWLTNIFSHASWAHLIGNLYFLGLFGLIVEGKLGWKRFIPLYLFLGIAESAVSQIVMLGADSGSALGASGAIMGLMAICMVWAPRNELSLIFILFIRAFVFDVTIMFFALFYIGWDLIVLAVMGFRMSSQALHLTGALIGFGTGLFYVKKEWVDCENWDLISVMKGKYGRFADDTTTVGSHADASLLFGRDVDVDEFDTPEPEPSAGTKRRAAKQSMRTIDDLIDSGRFLDASERLFDERLRDSDANPNRSRLKRLATGLHDANAFDEAQMFLEEYAERYPDQADAIHLRLAHIELNQRNRPSACLRALKKVRLSKLTPDQQRRAKKTVFEAKTQIRSGVEDAPDELDWHDDNAT